MSKHGGCGKLCLRASSTVEGFHDACGGQILSNVEDAE